MASVATAVDVISMVKPLASVGSHSQSSRRVCSVSIPSTSSGSPDATDAPSCLASNVFRSVITAGDTTVFPTHAARVPWTLESLDEKIDPASGETLEESPDFVRSGDAAKGHSTSAGDSEHRSVIGQTGVGLVRYPRYGSHGRSRSGGRCHRAVVERVFFPSDSTHRFGGYWLRNGGGNVPSFGAGRKSIGRSRFSDRSGNRVR